MLLIGGNGSGKSTLLKCIYKIIPLLSGVSSGGERKILAFGMVSVNKPLLLLFDEPFAVIDSPQYGQNPMNYE